MFYHICDLLIFFSQVGAYLLFLLTMSFGKQNFLILIKYKWSICSHSLDCAFCVMSIKSLPNPWFQKPRIFFPRSFLVLSFTVRNIIYFEVFFCLFFFFSLVLGMDQSVFFFFLIFPCL